MLPGHQLGIRTMSAVAYLREELRLPVNLVQRYLGRTGLLVSSGEIEWICTEVAEHLPPCRGLGDGLFGEPLHGFTVPQGHHAHVHSRPPFAEPPPAQHPTALCGLPSPAQGSDRKGTLGQRLPARPERHPPALPRAGNTLRRCPREAEAQVVDPDVGAVAEAVRDAADVCVAAPAPAAVHAARPRARATGVAPRRR